MLSFSRTFPCRTLKSQIRKHTYRPLDTEQSEQERDAVVPAASTVDETLAPENVRRTVHLTPRGCRKEDDDNDCKRIESVYSPVSSREIRTERRAEVNEHESARQARKLARRQAVLYSVSAPFPHDRSGRKFMKHKPKSHAEPAAP